MLSKKTVATVLGLAAAALAPTAGTAAAASAAVDDRGATLAAAVSTYRSAHPEMSAAAAEAAAVQAGARGSLYAALTKDGAKNFGGAWFDSPAGIVHIAATTPDTAGRAAAIGRDLGPRVQTHLVGRTFADLERQATALRAGADALSRAAHGQVGIDVKTNRVVVAVPAAQRAALVQGPLPAGVSVVDDPGLRIKADACTSRTNCDDTLRGGQVLWRSTVTTGNVNTCSVGFTARDPFGNRYVYTAGHCSTGLNVNWGTGAQSIGRMGPALNGGNIDAALISVTNATYTSDLGGEIYNHPSAGHTVEVDGVAPTLSYIVKDEVVCLSANFTAPTGSSRCGVVGSNSDWLHTGLVRVEGVDACGGDSGGGWYWLSNGRREAYGIHSSSDEGCNGSLNGDRSWFTAAPLASILNPIVQIETR